MPINEDYARARLTVITTEFKDMISQYHSLHNYLRYEFKYEKVEKEDFLEDVLKFSDASPSLGNVAEVKRIIDEYEQSMTEKEPKPAPITGVRID